MKTNLRTSALIVLSGIVIALFWGNAGANPVNSLSATCNGGAITATVTIGGPSDGSVLHLSLSPGGETADLAIHSGQSTYSHTFSTTANSGTTYTVTATADTTQTVSVEGCFSAPQPTTAPPVPTVVPPTVVPTPVTPVVPKTPDNVFPAPEQPGQQGPSRPPQSAPDSYNNQPPPSAPSVPEQGNTPQQGESSRSEARGASQGDAQASVETLPATGTGPGRADGSRTAIALLISAGVIVAAAVGASRTTRSRS